MTNPEVSELLTPRERQIARTGEKLAAQFGWVFRIVPQKLNDFRARSEIMTVRGEN